MSEHKEEKTLKDVLGMVFSQFKVFLIASALFMIVVLVASYYIPVRYSGTAVFERRGDSAAESVGNNPNESFQAMRLTLQQELAGNKAVEKVIDDLGLTRNLPRNAEGALTPKSQELRQGLINNIMADTKIDWRVRSDQVDQIAVIFSCSDPVLAQKIPNLLVKNYTAYVGEKIVERLNASRQFLLKQVKLANARVVDANKKKIEFEAQYGDMLVEGPNLQDRVQEINADLESLRRQQGITRQKMEQTKALAQNIRLKTLKEQLTQLKNEVDTDLTLNQMTREHPKVQARLARIALIESRIRRAQSSEASEESNPESVDNGMALQLATVASELQIVTDEIARLEKRQATYKAAMNQSVPLRDEYARLVKPLEDLQATLRKWQARLSDVEMTLAAEGEQRRTQLKTIQTASKPTRPAFPPAWAIFAIAIGGGLLCGYGSAFMAASVDRSIRRPEEMENLFGLPVVGVVGVIESKLKTRTRNVRTIIMMAVLVTVVLGSLGVMTASVFRRLEGPDRLAEWKESIPLISTIPGANSADKTATR